MIKRKRHENWKRRQEKMLMDEGNETTEPVLENKIKLHRNERIWSEMTLLLKKTEETTKQESGDKKNYTNIRIERKTNSSGVIALSNETWTWAIENQARKTKTEEENVISAEGNKTSIRNREAETKKNATQKRTITWAGGGNLEKWTWR